MVSCSEYSSNANCTKKMIQALSIINLGLHAAFVTFSIELLLSNQG